MLTFKRSGPSIESITREIRDLPKRIVPYAVSSALTKSAQAAKDAIVDEMPRAFDRPTPYTLNSLRVVPSSAQTLLARVAVKDIAGGANTAPEHYLLPEVEGGPREEKPLERALRFAGVLRAGERVVPGPGLALDAFGNIPSGTIRGVLSQLGVLKKNGQQYRSRKTKAGGSQRAYFAGPVGKKGTRGVWLREGRKVQPILIFTTKPPTYRSRLNFTTVAQKAVEAKFESAFRRALSDILNRG